MWCIFSGSFLWHKMSHLEDDVKRHKDQLRRPIHNHSFYTSLMLLSTSEELLLFEVSLFSPPNGCRTRASLTCFTFKSPEDVTISPLDHQLQPDCSIQPHGRHFAKGQDDLTVTFKILLCLLTTTLIHQKDTAAVWLVQNQMRQNWRGHIHIQFDFNTGPPHLWSVDLKHDVVL